MKPKIGQVWQWFDYDSCKIIITDVDIDTVYYYRIDSERKYPAFMSGMSMFNGNYIYKPSNNCLLGKLFH